MHATGFIEHVVELLAPLGRVSERPMFGGHGIYCDGLFIAIVLDDVLYLKADAESRAEFERAGCQVFSYGRKGKEPQRSTFTAHRKTRWTRRSACCRGQGKRSKPRCGRGPSRALERGRVRERNSPPHRIALRALRFFRRRTKSLRDSAGYVTFPCARP
jgi:TfoX/Sxy family transcriptional regulator of competence genes